MGDWVNSGAKCCPTTFIPCCLCATGGLNHCFAITGDNGVFDYSFGKTNIAKLNANHTTTDVKGQFDPWYVFQHTGVNECVVDGRVTYSGRGTIFGKETCYGIDLWFGFWCDEAKQMHVAWLKPLYWECWETDTCRQLKFDCMFCCWDPGSQPYVVFEELGTLNWDCFNYGVWSNPKRISTVLNWIDPLTSIARSVPIYWDIQIAARDTLIMYPPNPNCDEGNPTPPCRPNCPPHDNEDDYTVNYYTPLTQYHTTSQGVLINYYEMPAYGDPGYECCNLNSGDYGGSYGTNRVSEGMVVPSIPCCPYTADTVPRKLNDDLINTTVYVTASGNCATCTIDHGPFRWLDNIGPTGQPGWVAYLNITACGSPDPGGIMSFKMLCNGDGTWTPWVQYKATGTSVWVSVSPSCTLPCTAGHSDYYFDFTVVLGAGSPCQTGLFVQAGAT